MSPVKAMANYILLKFFYWHFFLDHVAVKSGLGNITYKNQSNEMDSIRAENHVS